MTVLSAWKIFPLSLNKGLRKYFVTLVETTTHGFLLCDPWKLFGDDSERVSKIFENLGPDISSAGIKRSAKILDCYLVKPHERGLIVDNLDEEMLEAKFKTRTSSTKAKMQENREHVDDMIARFSEYLSREMIDALINFSADSRTCDLKNLSHRVQETTEIQNDPFYKTFHDPRAHKGSGTKVNEFFGTAIFQFRDLERGLGEIKATVGTMVMYEPHVGD